MRRLTKKNLLLVNGAPALCELVPLGEHENMPVTRFGIAAPITPELIASQRADLQRKLEAAAVLQDAEVPEDLDETLDKLQEGLAEMLGAADNEGAVAMGVGAPVEICWN